MSAMSQWFGHGAGTAGSECLGRGAGGAASERLRFGAGGLEGVFAADCLGFGFVLVAEAGNNLICSGRNTLLKVLLLL